MNYISELCRIRNSKLVSEVYSSAAIAGEVDVVQAGVFEQTFSGKVVVMGSGALAVASLPGQRNSSGDGQQAIPTSLILSSLSPVADASGVPAGASLVADASPHSSYCDEPPAGTAKLNTDGLEVVTLISGQLPLPDRSDLRTRLPW